MPQAVAAIINVGVHIHAFLITTGVVSGTAALSKTAYFLIGSAAYASGLAILNNYVKRRFAPQGAARPETRQIRTAASSHARWIVGRARVGGIMAFYGEKKNGDNSEVHMAIVLSNGPCEKIEKIWLNGEEVSFGNTPGSLTPNDKYNGKFQAVPYLDGSGNGGSSLRAAFPTRWTSDHRLQGRAWVHIVMVQPPYSDSDNRFWTQQPQIEFLVKGLKIRWPGQSTPQWTENAAAIRYWWLTERLGIPATAINTASVNAARSLSAESVTVTLPTDYKDYSATSPRYTINGIIYADDDIQSVESAMDFAWQGHVVESGGVHYFRPGQDRTSVGTVNPDDIIEIGGVQPAPAIQDRANSGFLALAQSAEHDWIDLSLPEFVDSAALARDQNYRLPVDLGAASFVAYPIAGGRLLATVLRRARQSATFNYRLKPGADMRWTTLKPSDTVTINDPENGLTNFRAVVTSTVLHPDWSTSISFIEDASGTYADTLVLPPLKPRPIDIIDPREVPLPAGVMASITARPDSNPPVLWATISWNASGAPQTKVRWRKEGDSEWTYHLSESQSVSITIVESGQTHEYQVAHLNNHRIQSEWTALATIEVPAAATFDTGLYESVFRRTTTATPPAAPTTTDEQDATNGYVPPGFTDGPLGATSEMPYEWIFVRTRAAVADDWGKFGSAGLSSSLSVDTRLYEAVFARTKTAYPPPRIVTTAEQRAIADFVPNGATDNERGVTAEWPFEWIAFRERTAETDPYGEFSDWAESARLNPTQIRSGEDEPRNVAGRDGDFYLQLQNRIIVGVWGKFDGTWSRVSNHPDTETWRTGVGVPN